LVNRDGIRDLLASGTSPLQRRQQDSNISFDGRIIVLTFVSMREHLSPSFCVTFR
jgi:hypothetical protein